MTASLNHSGSDALPGRLVRSGVVVSETEDMCGQTPRSQFHVVARSLPDVVAAAKQILSLEGTARIKPQDAEVEIYKSRVFMKRIQIDHDRDRIRAIFVYFAVADQHRVVGFVKSQTPVSDRK